MRLLTPSLLIQFDVRLYLGHQLVDPICEIRATQIVISEGANSSHKHLACSRNTGNRILQAVKRSPIAKLKSTASEERMYRS